MMTNNTPPVINALVAAHRIHLLDVPTDHKLAFTATVQVSKLRCFSTRVTRQWLRDILDKLEGK